MSYDLFISYARNDNGHGCVSELVERIKKDFASSVGRELGVFFDKHEIKGMEDWRQRILQGLRESHLLLACLSPSYISSKNCEWEFVEYLKYEIGHLHGFNGIAPVYLVQIPGWNEKDYEKHCAAWVSELRRRQYFNLRSWYENGEAALREEGSRRSLEELNRQIVRALRRSERAEKSLGNVDAHNPHFVGRTANLRLLREQFVLPGNIGVLTAVNGLGGLGKTALAVEYTHAFADEYGGGRWQIRCTGKDDLRLALSDLATPIGFEFTEDEKKGLDLQFERVRRELRRLADSRDPHRCLLFLDNVDNPALLDPAQVARLNAGDWLHILATSRLGTNELHGSHKDRTFLAIDELPFDDALALIESYQLDGRFRGDAERRAATEIVTLLGCFTLAVESAAVFLGQYSTDVTCSAFLSRLKNEGLVGLDSAAVQSTVGVLHGEKRLGATLRPTLERLNESQKLALRFAALLPPDNVALPWLRALVAEQFPDVDQDAEPGYPDTWKNILRTLFSLRLLQSTGTTGADGQPLVVRMHRLVQHLVLLDCQEVERGACRQAVAKLMQDRHSSLSRTTNWLKARWEVEPLNALADLWELQDHPWAAWMLMQTGDHWYRLAEWSRAEPLMRRALALDEQRHGPVHPDVARDLNNLASLLQATNRFQEAEQLIRRVITIFEKIPAFPNPNLAGILNNLATLLTATNRLDEAEPLMRRALEIDERNLGPVHPDVARDLNNLAALLKATNRLREAEPLMRRVASIFENDPEFEHARLATSLNNLATLLRVMGRLDEAVPLMRRGLAIDEKNLGSEHPDVARDLHNLAEMLQFEGHMDEAESLMRRALEINERSFGPHHPIVAVSLSNLATLLHTKNHVVEAESLMRRALVIDENSLGPDHPDVARDLNNLAQLLAATNRSEEAEQLMLRALAIDENSLGPEHPDVARDLSNLAELLRSKKLLDEAETLMRRALGIDENSFGREHPNVAIRLNNLAGLLQTRNQLDEAEPLMRRVISIFEKSFGPEHPNVALSISNLATLLQETNRLDEAVSLTRRALAIDENSFGPDHPNVAIRLNNLAYLFQLTGRLSEAEPLMRRHLEIFLKFTRTTGHQHPSLQAAAINYGRLLGEMGRTPTEALAQLRAIAPEFFPN